MSACKNRRQWMIGGSGRRHIHLVTDVLQNGWSGKFTKLLRRQPWRCDHNNHCRNALGHEFYWKRTRSKKIFKFSKVFQNTERLLVSRITVARGFLLFSRGMEKDQRRDMSQADLGKVSSGSITLLQTNKEVDLCKQYLRSI